ncbi:MAG: DUF3617 family protein [Acidobacteriota bacterium]
MSRWTTRLVFSASVLGLAISTAPAPLLAADRLQVGLWEFTSTTDGTPNRFKHCVTPDEAGSINHDTRTARAYAEKHAAGRCTINDYKVEGSFVGYSLTCGDRTIRSRTTFHGDSSEGDLFTTVGGKETVSHVTARRIGACP